MVCPMEVSTREFYHTIFFGIRRVLSETRSVSSKKLTCHSVNFFTRFCHVEYIFVLPSGVLLLLGGKLSRASRSLRWAYYRRNEREARESLPSRKENTHKGNNTYFNVPAFVATPSCCAGTVRRIERERR